MSAFWALTLPSFAQFTTDALRFSQINQASTARAKGFGGAQTAVGGDISSLAGNPAGIALFTKSELTFTPELNSYNDKADYLGTTSTGKKDKLNISQAGVVFRVPTYRQKGQDVGKGWLSINFGVGYNRSHDLGNSFSLNGINTQSSIADFFADQATATGLLPSELASGNNALANAAYENYLIGYNNDLDEYFPEADVNNTQMLTDNRKGGQSEVNFGIAANYSNKLYLGASLALTSINYFSESIYKEFGFNSYENNDYSTTFIRTQSTKGSGVNGKLGIIYKPTSYVRLGVSYQTPTWYTIDDDFSQELSTRYGAGRIDSQFVSPEEIFPASYRVRTPSRINTGIAFFSKYGFISGDVEFVNYGGINFNSTTSDDLEATAEDNKVVRDTYTNAINYRIGAELKFDKMYVRGGYGQLGNPYRNKSNGNYQNTTISGGLGYRLSNYFIDLTYQNIEYTTNYTTYTVNGGVDPTADTKSNTSNIFLTVGLRF